MVFLAQNEPGQPVSVTAIARASGVPMEYLRKLLQLLTRAGLVQSERGRTGGFLLAKPAQQITMLQVVEAIDGAIDEQAILADGALGGNGTTSHGLRRWRRHAARQLREILDETTLEHLIEA